MTADENIRQTGAGEEKRESWQKSVLLYLHDLICMLAVIMILFLLWDGDWLLVLSNTFYREPEYGDIIVASKDSFRDAEPIIKRVIATEGQTVDIDYVSGTVFVDGKALQEDYAFTRTSVDEGMEFPLVVEPGCVFALGDNRNNSLDSRHPAIGLVDQREILGKALFLFYPGTNEGRSQRDFDRIGAVN